MASIAPTARSERFRPIAQLLRRGASPPTSPSPPEPSPEQADSRERKAAAPAYSALVAAGPHSGSDAMAAPFPRDEDDNESAAEDVAADVRRFRARLADALEVQMRRLLPELCRLMLGREYAIEPPDIAPVVRGLLAAHASRTPVRVHVAPADAARVQIDVPVLVDPSLAPGEVVIDVRDGVVDATFQARIASFLTQDDCR